MDWESFRPDLERIEQRFARRTTGLKPVPLFSATLRENQGHETDRSAAA